MQLEDGPKTIKALCWFWIEFYDSFFRTIFGAIADYRTHICRAKCAYRRAQFWFDFPEQYTGSYCKWECSNGWTAWLYAKLTFSASTPRVLATLIVGTIAFVLLRSIERRTGILRLLLSAGRVPLVVVCLYARYYRSRLICALSLSPQPKDIRRSLEMATSNAIAARECIRPPIGHSHRSAAYWRNFADMVIDTAGSQLGLPVYDVSPATRNAHRRGQRLVYDTKDIRMLVRWDAVPEHCILAMVDVDYYLDVPSMTYWLSYFKPTILYTFQPIQISGCEQDVSWFFNEDGDLETMVTGGETYRHKIWNWSTAVLTVRTIGRTFTFDVKVSRLSYECINRAIVVLTPATETPWYLGYFLPSHNLEHYRMDGPHKRIDVLITGVGLVSNIAVGSTSTFLWTDLLEILIMRQNSSKLDVATVMRIMAKEYVPPDEMNAPAWFKPQLKQMLNPDVTYVRATTVFTWLESVVQGTRLAICPHVPGQRAQHYEVEGFAELGDTPKYYAREITRPLVEDPAPVPAKSRGNDAAAVQRRIVDVRNTTQPPVTFHQYAIDFMNELVPDRIAGRGVPLEEYQVNERMTEPRQRRRFEDFIRHGVDQETRVKSFMKHEAYGAFGPPRNISTLPTSHTVQLSTYSLAFSDYLKGKGETSNGCAVPWYCPGRKPENVARLVHYFCSERTEVLVVDYSKLDGSISQWLRSVECSVYGRFFGPTSPVVKLLQSEWNAPAKTSSGLRYDPGYSRLSGSPITTDGNTVLCGFVAYCVLREAGYSHAEAWKNIGCIYGDDGILHATEGDLATVVAKTLGLTLKVARVSYGPVPFLGRVFLDPWSSIDSVQDPCRTIPKMHYTMTDVNVDIAVAAIYRARGLLDTDPHTPLLSQYAHYLIRRFYPTTEVDTFEAKLEKFQYACLVDQPYHRNWPTIDPSKYRVALGIISDLMDCGTEAIETLAQQLDDDAEESSWSVLRNTIQVKEPVIVDGDIRDAGEPKISQQRQPKVVKITVSKTPRPTTTNHATASAPTSPRNAPMPAVPPPVRKRPGTTTARQRVAPQRPRRRRSRPSKAARPTAGNRNGDDGARPRPASTPPQCGGPTLPSGGEPSAQPQQQSGDQLAGSVPAQAVATAQLPAESA